MKEEWQKKIFKNTMDTCFVSRKAAVLQHTHFKNIEKSIRRGMNSVVFSKPGNMPESSYTGKILQMISKPRKLLRDPLYRSKIEETARVQLLQSFANELEVHHCCHESRTSFGLNRVAFMEAVWSIVPRYRTQSMFKTGLNP